MSMNAKRLPISRANIVLVGAMAAGAIVTAVFGNLLGTAMLVVIAGGILIAALIARRPNSSDLERVNAIEYRDERDAALARRGFAVVGVAALILSLLEVLAGALLSTYFLERPLIGIIVETSVSAQLVVLCVVWGWANIVVVRRG